MKVALVTQSYKNDFRECQLLCESIDRFAPDNIMHFIFVNDEDYQMFKNIENKKHKVYKKGTIMPWYFIRIPWKMMGHHFHISLFSIPVREWILQQICKFGVFNVIGKEYDAVFNVDSECVFMRPFSIDELMKEGKFYMYKNEKITQPSHDDYYEAARKLFNNQQIGGGITYDYMTTPVCFQRDNMDKMLKEIASHNIFKSWKLALCNTYRFSEYYLYGIFCSEINNINDTNHTIIKKRLFPMINISGSSSEEMLRESIAEVISDRSIIGLFMQKGNRKIGYYIDYDTKSRVVKGFWK